MIVPSRAPYPGYPRFSPGADVRGLAGAEDIGAGVGAGISFQGGSVLKGVVTGVLVSLIVRLIDRAIFKER